MNKPISVDERLPECGEQCIIVLEVRPNIECGVYKGGGEWSSNWCTTRYVEHRLSVYRVTHWMPLPEALKEVL